MNIERILSVILIAFSIANVIYTSIMLIKKKRQGATKEELESEVYILRRRNEVLCAIPAFINEAEEVFKGVHNPMGKLMYVVTKTQMKAVELGINMTQNEITNEVENKYLATPQKKTTESVVTGG